MAALTSGRLRHRCRGAAVGSSPPLVWSEANRPVAVDDSDTDFYCAQWSSSHSCADFAED